MFRVLLADLLVLLQPKYPTLWVGMIHEGQGFARAAQLQLYGSAQNDNIALVRVSNDCVHVRPWPYDAAVPREQVERVIQIYSLLSEAHYRAFRLSEVCRSLLFLHWGNEIQATGSVRCRVFGTYGAMIDWLVDNETPLEELPTDALMERGQ